MSFTFAKITRMNEQSPSTQFIESEENLAVVDRVKHSTADSTGRNEQKRLWREQMNAYIEANIAEIVDNHIPEDAYVEVTKHPETGESLKVVDVSTLQTLVANGISVKGVQVKRDLIALQLYQRHLGDDKECVTTTQVAKGDYTPKPLFYTPASVEAATDPLEIADAEYHLPLWELQLGKTLSGRESVYPTEDGAHLTAFEARVAIKLFKDGDARRSLKDGRLYVKHPDKKREPLTKQTLKAYNLLDRLVNEYDPAGRRGIREGLQVELPNLLHSGALQLDDIRELNANKNEVSSSGSVSLNEVLHYVGRNHTGSVAERLDDDSAVLLSEESGTTVVTGLFTIVDRENASDEYVNEQTGHRNVRANIDKTKPVVIDYERLLANDQSGLQGELRPEKVKALQKLITDRFTALNDVADKAEDLVRSEAPQLDEDQLKEMAEHVRTTLIAQAQKVVELAASATDERSLRQSLTSFTFDARAYVALLQSLGVERMLSNPLREVASTELTEAQQQRMLSLLRENYQAMYPGEEYKEFRDAVESSLIKSFHNDLTKFYLLENDDEIVSFNRFDKIRDNSDRKILYFGSFNADSTYRGVGGEMLEKTIEKKMHNSDFIFAHCDPKMAISQKYIEDGFVATQTETVAGHFSFEIWRSGTVLENLKTKQMTKDDLVAKANISPGPESDYFVREVEPSDRFDELDSGLAYLLTRYFTYEVKTYVAFELNPAVSKEFVLMTGDEETEQTV
ncbi:MAG TPA: hypothetical protein VKP88_06060 [Candidatus Paceibacterota bacterium]|nr:hypothetical protein [Candidatus Paceibacterota bacterium]